MKKLIALLALFPTLAFCMTENAKKEIADVIVSGDYQKLRNVAYGMETGTFGHDQNLISACALRRVILLVHSNKADISDYNNEAITCRKVDVTKNEQSWKITQQILASILAKK